MTGELMEEAKPVKTLPRHVAVIMDGNGRWAKNRHMPRVEGHRRGVSAVESCTEAARRAGIKALTLFAFSSENWKRPEEEVSALMRLFGLMLVNQREKLVKNDIRLHVAGDVSAFSDPLRKAIEETERATEHCSAMQLTICANYGGRWDIVQAVTVIINLIIIYFAARLLHLLIRNIREHPHHELQSSLIALVLAVAAYAAGAQVTLLAGDDEGAYVLAFQG